MKELNKIYLQDCIGFMRELKAESVDLVIADPPYNLKKNFENQSDCWKTVEDWLDWSKQWIDESVRVLKPTGSIFIYGIHNYLCYLQSYLYKKNLRYRRQIIWYYENGFSGYKTLNAFYEPILWFSKTDTFTFHEIREPYKSQKRLQNKIFKNGKEWKPNPEGRLAGDVWQFPTLAGKRFEKEKTAHPTQKLVNNFPEIETPKLLLALEAENDSDEEFERISNLAQKDIEQIISEIGTTDSMAANAVKILPGIAEQLGDIERINNQTYLIGQIVITEDEITTEEQAEIMRKAKTPFWKTSVEEIAKAPNLKNISTISIDLAEAVKIRQKRLAKHQEIVRVLAKLNEDCGFQLFEGKFDCLAIIDKTALLYEVKTILEDASDTEKQTVKGVGQLKFYKFSIVHRQMGYSNIKEILVFSQRPAMEIIEFCLSEDILVIWKENNNFKTFNTQTINEELFNPIDLL